MRDVRFFHSLMGASTAACVLLASCGSSKSSNSGFGDHGGAPGQV